MQRPKFPGVGRRKSSTLHYQTFPVKPPTSRGRPPSSSPSPSGNENGRSPGLRESSPSSMRRASPLPKKQLAVLAVIALAEQTALNSISPYLPEMASTFPEVEPSQVGLYVGLIASSFALAQFSTGFLWGWLSDHIGRKPIILLGTLLTAVCFVAFGFCRTFWQAMLVQALMGLVNGNQGVVSTCLGEITDKSNQSEAFTYLPVIYGIGSITGPIVGGLLVLRRGSPDGRQSHPYPYLPPNLFSAGVLIVDLVISMIFLEESLDVAKSLPPLGRRVSNLFTWIWQFTSSTRPSYLRLNSPAHSHHRQHVRPNALENNNQGLESGESQETDGASTTPLPAIFPEQSAALESKHIMNRDTILLLATYLIFQLSNISFNSLYPVFISSPPPTGRDMSPRVIGLSLAFAGVVTILFQVGVFARLREILGNKATYRIAFAGFTVAFFMMPWVGYKENAGPATFGAGRIWLWIEIGFILLIKTIATVGGLTSALLLVSLFLCHLAHMHAATEDDPPAS